MIIQLLNKIIQRDSRFTFHFCIDDALVLCILLYNSQSSQIKDVISGEGLLSVLFGFVGYIRVVTHMSAHLISRNGLQFSRCKKFEPQDKGKKKDRSNVGDEKEDVRGYFTWNLDMERVLAEALRDQRSLGRQNDGVWKTLAYNAVAGVLSTRFNVKLNEENIKNHIKLWRRWYRIVGIILGQSGFDWDDTKCMITVKDENAWDEYVKVFSPFTADFFFLISR